MPELWSLQGHRHIKDLASISNISKLKHWLRHTRQIVPHHLVIIWRSYHLSIIIQPPHTLLAYEVISILSSSAASSTLTSHSANARLTLSSFFCPLLLIFSFLCLRCRLCLQLILFISPIFLNYFCALPYSYNMDPINKSRDIKEQNRICSWSGSLKCFVLILSWKYSLWIFVQNFFGNPKQSHETIILPKNITLVQILEITPVLVLEIII